MMAITQSHLPILPSLKTKHRSYIEKGLQDGKEDYMDV
jgi:hypothetical protein